jgi:hypothetical protein
MWMHSKLVIQFELESLESIFVFVERSSSSVLSKGVDYRSEFVRVTENIRIRIITTGTTARLLEPVIVT